MDKSSLCERGVCSIGMFCKLFCCICLKSVCTLEVEELRCTGTSYSYTWFDKSQRTKVINLRVKKNNWCNITIMNTVNVCVCMKNWWLLLWQVGSKILTSESNQNVTAMLWWTHWSSTLDFYWTYGGWCHPTSNSSEVPDSCHCLMLRV